LVAVCLCSPAAAQQTARKPILPVEPDKLIQLLPSAPEGWKITSSTASTNFSDWLSSQATRTFSAPSSDSRGGQSTAPVANTRVSLSDSGYYPEFLGQFIGLRPAKEKDVQTLFVNGFPAVRISRANSEILSVLIKGRYIAQIRTENQKPNTTLSWFKLLDIGKIAAVPDSGPDKIPQPVTLTRIDELDPRNNSAYQLNWTSKEQNQQEIAREKAEAAKRP
jgi:hypothetical protein